MNVSCDSDCCRRWPSCKLSFNDQDFDTVVTGCNSIRVLRNASWSVFGLKITRENGEHPLSKAFLASCVLLTLGSRRHRRLNRLSGLEKELKKTVEEKSAELETAERRLVDMTEALRSQKQLRVKEMHENQVRTNTAYVTPRTVVMPLLT